MAKAMIAMELVSMLFMLVILYGLIFETKNKTSVFKYLMGCVICCLLGLAADVIAWALDRTDSLMGLQLVSNYYSMVGGSAVVAFFIYYEITYINQKRSVPIPKKIPAIIAILNIVVALIMIIPTQQGKVFTLGEGLYETTWLYSICPAVNVLSAIIILIIALVNYNILGMHDVVALALYALFPIIATTVEIASDAVSSGFVTISVSLMIIYVMLQTNQMDELRLREKLLREAYSTDSLTGLPNRRAYNETLDKIKTEEIPHGVLYCDVNGLKHANDHLGHEAGDELLVSFGHIFGGHFPNKSVFRISGDEFVAVLDGMTEEQFKAEARNFRVLCFSCSEIASVGHAYGSGDIYELVSAAEKDMYKEKAAFYTRNPQYGRRKSDADEVKHPGNKT